MEILTGHDIGRGLGPVARHLHLALFKDRLSLFIGNRGGASFPLEQVVRCLTGVQAFREMTRESQTPLFFDVC